MTESRMKSLWQLRTSEKPEILTWSEEAQEIARTEYLAGYDRGEKDNTKLMASFKEREIVKANQDYAALEKDYNKVLAEVDELKVDAEKYRQSIL